MRALTIRGTGGLEQIEFRDDLPVPEIQASGDVRVRVAAGALNHLDLFVIEGLPGVTMTPPWVLGSDGVGLVESVGAAVTSVAVGDRVVINAGTSCRVCEYCVAGEHPLCVKFSVLGEHRPGTLAEYVVLPAVNVRWIPAGIPDAEAAAFTLATLTAWRMVVTRARVQAGEEVLVQGIGGGVALAAMQIAKSRGARVWVTSSSDEKLARAKALGADETLNYTTTDVAREIRARTGKRGVQVVIDSGGTASWKPSLGALGRAGRLVTCGGTTGPMVETDVRKLFWNQWTLMGSTMGSESEFEAVVAELAAGRLVPMVDRVFPLEEGHAGYARMAEKRQFGKIVLAVGPQR